MSTVTNTSGLKPPHQAKLESQDVKMDLENKNGIIKLYSNNAFIGIAQVEKSKNELTIPDHIKDSLTILTGETEADLHAAFSSIVEMNAQLRPKVIDDQLASIILFIKEFEGNPRFKPHVTKCDVDSMIDQIEKLQKQNPPAELAARLEKCKVIVTTFKIDKVLCTKPLLERNNEFNIRYYNNKIQDGFKTFDQLQSLLSQSEEGPIDVQLEDLHKCGKIVKENDVPLGKLKHGDLVCFERVRGQPSGKDALSFAVVDKIQESTELRVQRGNQSYIFVPKHADMTFTRLNIK